MNSLQIRWRHLLALSLILLCSVSALFARPLSEREARHLAEQFFHQVAYAHKVLAPAQQPLSLVSAPIRQSAGVELRTVSGDKARYYYIYNRGSNAGFVIIAGDDELTPYIGYATTGQVLEQDMPEQLRAFLKACQERIDELTSSVGLRSSLRPTPRTATEPAQIAPLLGNIQWNQSAPWNNQTPIDNQGEHMPVGCVATAYTQVMRYHQWPTQGEGSFSYTEGNDSRRSHTVDFDSTTYDWAHMPERYNDPSSATSEETQALSTLAYHAGVAVEMMYAPSGSGSYTPLVARALADHFRYDKRVSFKSRSNYTQSSWEQMLRAELIAARPVVYSGTGSGGGHAFVCDGYDMEGLFHINWGWGGMSDGYFNLNYLVPSDLGIGGGAGGGFSLGQGAVVGIKPDKTGSSQRQESSLVTTWRFGMTFTEGTLDASAEYTVTLTTDATPYDGSVTYGVTKVGTTDTLYLDQYARNARIDGLYQGFSIGPEELQLSNHIGVGTWDIFLAYRHTDATGQTAWRPCGQHERAKEQYRHTYTITQESDGSYVVTEEASSDLSMLELVAGSVQSYTIVGYEKSKVSLQIRNTGRVEFFDQLYLHARKVGERIFEPVVNILPAIGAGEVKEVTFEIDRFPYGSGDVELTVGYFIGNRFNQLSKTTVSIQSATDIRTAYVLSSDQPVTVNVNSGNLSQIRIRNIGTKTPTNRVFYRWELRKEKQTASTRWTQIDIPAGGEQLVAPNLAGELSQIGAERGDNITLTATFIEVSDEGRIISVIPLMEEPKLSVYCDGELVVGDGVITMTTARAVGKDISLAYWAEGDVVIEGATGTPKEKEWVDYTLTSQQVSLRGDITVLGCIINELTNLDVSQCSSLKSLMCFLNQIEGEAMTQLVNSLPDRTGKEAGFFVVYSHSQEERNICLKSDVAIAKAKNWQVALATLENGEVKYYLYEGEDDSQPSVGDGVITMTTSRAVGEQIMLSMSPVEGQTVIAEGLKEPLVLDDQPHRYTLTSQTVTLRGNLTSLNCNGLYSRGEGSPISHQNQLTNLDVSRCNTLSVLDCSDNLLQSLDVSSCNALTALYCSGNSLQSLDVSSCKTLRELSCSDNLLQSLDVSRCNALTALYCSENSLQSLDVSSCKTLSMLSCAGNSLQSLDVSSCKTLRELYCSDNSLQSLDVSSCKTLRALYCSRNSLQSLDITHNEALTSLSCCRNQLETLDLSYARALTKLDVSNNRLTDIDLSQCLNLQDVDLDSNQLTDIDLSQCLNLRHLILSNNQLTSLDVSHNPNLEVLHCYGNQIKGEAMTALVNGLPDRMDKEPGRFQVIGQDAKTDGNICLESDVAIAKAKNWSVEDENGNSYEGEDDSQPSVGDGVITMTTTRQVGEQLLLSLSAPAGEHVIAEGLKEPLILDGTEHLYTLTSQTVTLRGNLMRLNCGGGLLPSQSGEPPIPYRNQLTNLDVSRCNTLSELDCAENSLQSLDVSGCNTLSKLRCSWNSLQSLDVSGCNALTVLYCSRNSLQSLDVSSCKTLRELYCYGNSLQSLDITHNEALTYLYCSNNQLETLDLSHARALTQLIVFENRLTALDLSQCLNLRYANLSRNQLTALDVSKNTELETLHCYDNQIKGKEMTRLVNSLPDRTGKEAGTFTVVQGPKLEGNICLKSDVAIAKGKNWNTLKYESDIENFVLYEGAEDAQPLKVTLTKEGEGTLTATGADDLNAVPYGTELTVEATPAEGYVLTALTANGKDILATKKLNVRKDTEIKATFAKGDGVITMTTAKSVGESIRLGYIAAGDVSIEGANGSPKSGQYVEYALTNQQITLRGYITELDCSMQLLTDIDVSQCSSLRVLSCYVNEIKGESMLQLVNSLPDRTGLESGTFVVYSDGSLGPEGNVCLKSDVAIARAKNWEVYLAREEYGRLSLSDYDGVDPTKTFAVTFAKVGKGTLTATGADDLNAVPYGTELTVEATPAEGYELTALTAYGEDILATKKLTVREDTEIKATFTKVGDGVITMTTAKSVGTSIRLAYWADSDVSIGGAIGDHRSSISVDLTLTNQQVTMRGNITTLYCNANRLTDIDVSQCSSLTTLLCVDNEIKGKSMLQLVNSLPDRTGLENGFIIVSSDGSLGSEGNVCLKSDVAIARAKNWEVLLMKTENGKWEPYLYDGEDPTKTFAVTLTQGDNGTISATGADDLNAVLESTELTITDSPKRGYELIALTANGEDILATKKLSVREDTEIKATFAKKKNYTVTFTKEGEGTLTATGADDLNAVPYGTELTVEAAPAEGYELTALTANGTDILASKKVVVTSDLTIKATFTKKSFAVSLTKEGEGSITATGATSLNAVAYGTELTIVATPAEGYELTALTANGTDILASKKVVVTSDLTIKATFAKKSFAVSLTKEGEGSITATGASDLNSVAYGTELTINATPAEGYELTALTANGTDILATKKIVVKDNLTVKATFAKKSFAVTFAKEGEGTITATGADDLNAVAYGTELTIVATPAEGYELTALTANGTDILASKKIVVTSDLTIKATFAKKSFAVSLTKEGEGSITATGATSLNAVAYGTELTINATPAEGYELTALTANGTDILATKKIVVKDNLTVKATFEKKTFAVTLTSNEHGEITIVEPVNLKAVPYGTTLTVQATGKNAQCVLTELTANGKDILATKSFVVTGVTEVKATFVDHTGVETTVTHQTQLYPNPATDYVIVKGIAPASEVMLHSMTGELLCAMQADAEGHLQIDLTALSDGVYLLVGTGWQERLVVKK